MSEPEDDKHGSQRPDKCQSVDANYRRLVQGISA